MKKITKIIALVMAMLMLLACCFGCKKKPADVEPTASETPTESPAPEIEYEPATMEYVAKVGEDPIYDCEFYYFLYQGIREIYLGAEDVYDETLSDEENMNKLLAYFEEKDAEGVSNMQKAVDIAFKAAYGFKIAVQLGKDAGEKDAQYKLSEEEIKEMENYIKSEAEYYASQGYPADEYFVATYGMNVNESIRYSIQQMYSERGETAWLDETGWTIGMEEPIAPEEPLKPDDLPEDATEEQKAEYATTLAEYEKDLEEYPTKLAEYEKQAQEYENKKAAYYEKFREYYEKDKDAHDIPTIRYLLLSKGDDAAAAKAKIDKYIKYFEDGETFEALVKGFSESPTATENLGLVDVDLFNLQADLGIPSEVIEWADKQTGITEKLEIVETADAYYLVKVEGFTDFDKSEGIKATDVMTNQTVRDNVEYVVIADLYNTYIESFMDKEEFKVTEKNNDKMLELAKEYLNIG